MLYISYQNVLLHRSYSDSILWIKKIINYAYSSRIVFDYGKTAC